MPSKKKAAPELPTIPKELIDHLVTGPMTPEAVRAGLDGVQEGADRAGAGRRAVAQALVTVATSSAWPFAAPCWPVAHGRCT
jgi:hypothetical protein